MSPPHRKDDSSNNQESSAEQQMKNGKEKKGKPRDSDTKPAEWKDCLRVARWIPRAYDMYCNLEEVIRVSLIIEHAETLNSEDEDEDEEEVEKVKAAHEKVLSTIGNNTIERYKHIYEYLENHTPYLFELIHGGERSKRANLIREMQSVINCTRSDDASHFRPAIGTYAAPDPDNKVLDPPVPLRGPRDRLGFNHPELARLLCPVRHLQEMLNDPVGTKKKIETGAIKVTALKHPAFLYEGVVPGADFDPEDSGKGFLRGYFLERTMKHIFTSPGSALSTTKSQGTRPSNAKIHGMKEVDAYHIAYAATQARLGICAHNKVVDEDGHFRFPDFYYRMVDFLVNDAESTWVTELYAHYNKLLFGNERGVGHDADQAPDGEAEDDSAIMKRQMAERAAKAAEPPAAIKPPAAEPPEHAPAAPESRSSPVIVEERSTSTSEVSERSTTFSSANASSPATTPVSSPNRVLQRKDRVAIVVDTPSPARTSSPRQPGPSTPSAITKGKRKQDVVPLDPDSPLTDVAEEKSANVNKRRKKGKSSAGERSTGATGRKSTRSRK